jgi:hypothetical protein
VLKQLSIIAGAAAVVAAPIAMFTWPAGTQQGAAQATEASVAAPIQVVAAHPNYDAGMRIIHVPDAGAIAAYPRQSRRQLNVEPPVAPKVKPQHVAMPTPAQPRRILPPPVTEPKRAVLSAPPPPPNSLTPIRPTPRWRSIEKFTMPPEEKLSTPAESPASATSVSTATETPAAPVSSTPTETAAAPAPAETPDIDDDSPPPAD